MDRLKIENLFAKCVSIFSKYFFHGHRQAFHPVFYMFPTCSRTDTVKLFSSPSSTTRELRPVVVYVNIYFKSCTHS